MKLKGTYIDALPQLVHPETGRVHTCFNQAVAATGTPEQQRSEPAEHPDPHAARPRDPPRLHRRSGQRADLGRLLADRVPRARAPVRGPGAGRRVPRGRRLSRADRGQDLRRRQRPRSARAAQHREDGQLRAALRQDARSRSPKDIGVTQQAAQEFIDAYFAGFPSVRAFIDRTLEEARATGVVKTMYGRRRLVPELNSRDFQRRVGGGARGGQHADPGQRRRHHEARDDRRPRRARCRTPRRA